MNPFAAMLQTGGGFGISVEINGVDAVVRALRGIPRKISKRILKPAMRKASAPIGKAARRRVAKDSGLLGKSLGTKIKDYASGNVISVTGPRTGFKQAVTRKTPWGTKKELANPSNYGHLVEEGTRAHAIGKGAKRARVGPGAARAALRRAHRVSRWRQEIRKGVVGRRKYALMNRIARAREITARANEQIQRGKTVRGARARPFLRPAAEQSKGEFLSIFKTEVQAGIAKELAKT